MILFHGIYCLFTTMEKHFGQYAKNLIASLQWRAMKKDILSDAEKLETDFSKIICWKIAIYIYIYIEMIRMTF